MIQQLGYESVSDLLPVVGMLFQLDLSDGKSMRRTEAGIGFGDSGAEIGLGMGCKRS